MKGDWKCRSRNTVPLQAWWWYIIKYSNQFDPDEVERCKKLGLSERMEQALRQLEYVGLDPKKREAYAKEVTEIDTYDDELRRMKLRGLLAGFIDFQKISSTIVQEIQNWGKLFPRSLVEVIGNRYIGE
ncbi:MAG: hypothetical protein LBD60_02315 [Puniceicoccales bacterium]|jgi:hypothetical protein|nr:hypothetical protein [Puniceicoccales bacterium]